MLAVAHISLFPPINGLLLYHSIRVETTKGCGPFTTACFSQLHITWTLLCGVVKLHNPIEKNGDDSYPLL